MQLPATLRERILRAVRRERAAGPLAAASPAARAVLSWIRNIALPDDLFVLESAERREVLGYPFPSFPESSPAPATDAARDRVRFHIRDGLPSKRPGLPPEEGFRPIVRLRALEVWERDTPHGPTRPLRLGLSAVEARAVLSFVRARAVHSLGPAGAPEPQPVGAGQLARLSHRLSVGVAVWTRGRLRGSVVSPAGPALRTFGLAATWVCKDGRFERLTAADLEDTVFEATLIHAPRTELTREEIATDDAYHDKAIFLFEGTRSGMYLPEVFNVGGARKLTRLTETLARDKAGLSAFGPKCTVEVCEVTDFVESADRAGVVELDGPVARWSPGEGGVGGREAAVAACEWLARIQGEDGRLPVRVRASSGEGLGADLTRSAMTAHALAECGAAFALPSATSSGRLAFDHVVRTRVPGDKSDGLLTSAYLGKAAFALSGREGAAPFVGEIVGVVRETTRSLPVLVASQLLTFLTLVAGEHADAAAACGALQADLGARWTRVADGDPSASLAEWAELAMAPDRDLSARVRRWLVGHQLPSGAFPDSPSSSFVYSRGTGKVFEVLAAAEPVAAQAAEAALAWLRGMQYRADSAFFIPTEHRPRLLGGLRHDHWDTDAWIDAAGHLLLGLARLEAR
jgi:AMMECR1 domain-containing protein